MNVIEYTYQDAADAVAINLDAGWLIDSEHLDDGAATIIVTAPNGQRFFFVSES